MPINFSSSVTAYFVIMGDGYQRFCCFFYQLYARSELCTRTSRGTSGSFCFNKVGHSPTDSSLTFWEVIFAEIAIMARSSLGHALKFRRIFDFQQLKYRLDSWIPCLPIVTLYLSFLNFQFITGIGENNLVDTTCASLMMRAITLETSLVLVCHDTL